MKNTTRAIVLFAVLAAAASAALAATAEPRVTAATLDNGLKVITREDHSTDLVAVDIWVRAGSAFETAENNGVSHFIEHLLFRATEKRGPGQIDMEIESVGASAEARTSRDWAHFYTVAARRYLDKSLDILADAVMHPLFLEGDIEHERRVILDEIARKESDPWAVLRDHVFATAYTTHPYRLPIEGTRDSIQKITRDMIVGHYSKLYVPGNTAVVLVGDVTPKEASAAVRKAFTGFKNAPMPNLDLPKEPIRSEQSDGKVKKNTRLDYVAIAFPAPSVKDRPDVYAMDVLTSYLGAGYQSWMLTELRDADKLAVDASSDFLTQRDPSLMVLTAATEPSKAEKTKAAILAKIDELRTTPIDETDLARAKRSLEGGYAFDIETFQGYASTLGFYEAIDSFGFAGSYIQNIRKVTAGDITALAQKYLDPNRAIVVILGP